MLDSVLPRLMESTVAHPSAVQSNRARPHICFVAPAAWPVLSPRPELPIVGGAEVQQCIVARLLVRAGYQVSMICLDYGQPARVVVDGITVHKVHAPDSGWPVVRFVHPRLTTLWRVMREIDADIYYQRAAGMLTAVVATFCRRYGKCSIYAGASDSDFLPGRQEIRYARDRWLFEKGLTRADCLVVQNPMQQRYCLEHYGRRSVLLPNCYELPANAKPGRGTTVLWVGVMRPGKRPALFLDLARRLPQFRFVMVGGAESGHASETLFEEIRAAAKALPNVELTGFLPVDRVEPHFDRAAVLVNTSDNEGVPNTFLQAWARGIPTVAYVDIGARYRAAPVYYVARDQADAAAEIQRLFTDDIHRARLSSRCRSYFAETHAPEGVLPQYEWLLDTLSGRRPE